MNFPCGDALSSITHRVRPQNMVEKRNLQRKIMKQFTRVTTFWEDAA